MSGFGRTGAAMTGFGDERKSKTTQRWTAVINGEMRRKQPEAGHISIRLEALWTQNKRYSRAIALKP